ncbi:MAG: U32 family peptidase [Bacteroidales bacterium]|jgi:putative protease|nr:U32 family peptidase [Bacteroidales bacterium]NMD02896.1 U32 family peptidase [Bacteroidales bacterium]OQB64581.1 MAG: putative protease YhbU precursor [Bacteroidetes bacterium ADurb.Bin145]HOU00964.1 peptidase U32 family protein [Bacteroidales bacterium]HQK66645.1 peptidase U32 family protein [Bacteroidales bacterium]
MDRKEIEIMAPAGSYESLMAAIQGGADSVYFGAEHLNMRAGSSNNFTIGDLNKISGICKSNGLKSYLTVNIVIYDHEIKQMQEIIDAAAECGISAIIASDLSAILYAYQKGIEVHLSTQLNISNTEALKFYSQWADVAVLARELNLSQVEKIYNSIIERDIRGPGGELVKIEMFAHGALCMAISGKCYLSLHENNMSANRGNCYQTCRKSYIVTEKESGNQLEIDNEYIMSPRDLCTIGFIDKMLNAGVRVLKIEGRARSPEYVKIVSACYNEAVGAVIDGTYSDERIAEWKKRLSSVFNRGFWDGHYLGQRLGEWNTRYGSSAERKKLYLGKITNYFTRIGVAEIKLENGDLDKEDEILIIGPSTGVVEFKVDEIRVDLKKTISAHKGEYCSIKIEHYLRRSDKVYKWIDNTDHKDQ